MYRHFGKRAFDVVVGSLLALVILPVLLVIAVGSAVVFRTWPIFVQPRVGRDGRTFALLKLRSMPRTAPVALDKYTLHDVRIPAWGRLLRRTHLDELPQLLLVPFGGMSLVGPRPEMPVICDRYLPEILEARQSVRPGCTGLWQVSRALTGMIYEAPEYDLAYVANVGLRLDVWVLVKSVSAILLHRPIESLDDVPASLLPVASKSSARFGAIDEAVEGPSADSESLRTADG